MNKLMKVMLLLAFAVGSFGAYRHIAAQERAPRKGLVPIALPKFDEQISQSPDALATKHILEGTYINSGFYGAVVAAGATVPTDTKLTVACPGTSGTCTIEADMWVQSDGVANDAMRFAFMWTQIRQPTGVPWQARRRQTARPPSAHFRKASAAWRMATTQCRRITLRTRARVCSTTP